MAVTKTTGAPKATTGKAKAAGQKYFIDFSGPAADGILDAAAFEKFLHDRIKVDGKAGQLGDVVQVQKEGEYLQSGRREGQGFDSSEKGGRDSGCLLGLKIEWSADRRHTNIWLTICPLLNTVHPAGEGKIHVITTIPFSKRYLKYLTKKFLKRSQLRDWLRVVATSKNGFEIKFFNVSLDQEEDEE